MDIMELGAIGELVGGAAVIATLIYLAVQIRQGNRAGKREAYRGWVSEMNRVWMEPMRDSEFIEVFQKGNLDWDSLSPKEQLRLNSIYAPTFMLFQEFFAQREAGEIDEHLRLQLDTFAAVIVQMPGLAKWWEINRDFWSPSFVAHLDRCVSEGGPPPAHEIFPFYVGQAAPNGTARV